MFKKLLITSMILASTTTLSVANAAPYAGVSLGGAEWYSHSGYNVIGNIFLGYSLIGGPKDILYLAGELNVSYAHTNGSYYYSNNNVFGYGMSVLPGILVGQSTLIYGRAGLNATYPYHNYHYSNYGSHLGVGIQTNISGNWDMRLEYVRLMTPNANSFDLGLVYKF